MYLIIGLVIWLVSATTIHAEENNEPPSKTQPKVITLPMMIDCGPVDEVLKMISQYGETPLAKAIVSWKIPNGTILSGPMAIWANPETFTVSVTIQPSPDGMCIVLPGKDFSPFTSGNPT